MEAESSPSACTFLEPRIKPEAVIPDTFSSRTDTSYTSTQDEPSSGAFQVEPHTKSSIDPCSSSLASGGSTNQQNELSVTVGGQCHNHIFTPLSSLKSVKETPASPELTQSVSGLNPDDIVHSRTNVAYDELQQRQCRENGIETTQYDHKETSPWRASEDGYNWRKYGQKHIKGSEFPRSYYKCSYSNCHAKKQVERSQNGRVTDVVYKGQHDHAKPQINSQMSGGTVPLIHEERSNGVSFSCNLEDISSNGHHQPSPRAKPNVAPELPPSDNNMEDAGEKLSRLRDRVENEDHPESKRRRIMSNLDSSEFPSNRLFDPSAQEGEEKSENIVSTNSIANVDEAVSKNELILSVTVRDPSVDMITSRSIVPFGVDSDDVGQRSGKYLQAVRSDQKGSTRFVTSERLLGDGYNWRKYGQKHIKGSEFPRSYYRCTHPNCQVKKQLERSHDGQITEIIYKGEHDHPKPHLSSHMPIARFLSVQDEGSDRISSLNCTEDKSSNGNSQITQRLELNGTSELSPTVTSVNNVQGEGSQSQWTNSMAENDDSESKCRCLKFSKESGNAGRDSNHKQADTSVEVEVRFQSESLVSSPSPKNMDANSHELTPPITILPPPFYMVTSRGIVPVEVGSNELRQTQGSDSGALALPADQNGVSMEVTERLLENAYHWRKYGQKNIKGSPFPRSYYRCTHPSCQVKMQLEKSHDGRIIEVMCKGKHDHPKPQPINRMAIGAILSLEDERPGRSSINSIGGGTEEKPSNGNAQTSLEAQQICSPEFSPFSPSDDDVECAGVKSNKNHHEVEDGKDSEFKYRKDTGDVAEFIQAVRAPKEPRFVVETLSEYDVVDDGYRWQKYGRKMVKGNPYPRNYYRCSATACPVKKHVERSSHNSKALVTTYEGKHNHDLPPRPTGQELVQKLDSSDMFVTSSDLDNVSMDVEPQKSQSDDVDPDCSKAIATNLVSAHDGHLVENADQDKSRNEQSGSFSPDAPSLSHSSNLKEQKMEIQ